MKKRYQKPALLFEDFTLMETISTNCSEGSQANHSPNSACYIEANDNFPEPVFLESNQSCEVYDVEFYENIGFIVFSS